MSNPNQWGERNHQWKGESTGDKAKRTRARNLFPVLGPCEGCGGEARERHHRDGDPGNNDASNIAFVCRRCHMTMDGRLEQLKVSCRAKGYHKTEWGATCRNCGREAPPLRRGRCERCYDWWRSKGGERPPVQDDLRKVRA